LSNQIFQQELTLQNFRRYLFSWRRYYSKQSGDSLGKTLP